MLSRRGFVRTALAAPAIIIPHRSLWAQAFGNSGGPSLANYYAMPEPARGNPGNNVTSGKTLTSLPGSFKTILTYGQSLDCNNNVDSYTILNPTKLFMLNPYDGLVYQLSDPLLGPSGTGQSYWPRVGDGLIANGISNVLLCNVAAGGSGIADWCLPTYGATAAVMQRLVTGFLRLRALGITPDMVHQCQGEYDTEVGTTQAQYTVWNASVISWFRATFGYAGYWAINEETWYEGTISTAIETAQAAQVSGNTVAGADFDSMNATYRQADNIHLNSAGCQQGAALTVTNFMPYL